MNVCSVTLKREHLIWKLTICSFEPQAEVTHSIRPTHLCLVLLSRHAPATMPTISSTPRAPATTSPRNRPTAVVLLESVFAGLSLSNSTGRRMAVTVQTGKRSYYYAYSTIYTINKVDWNKLQSSFLYTSRSNATRNSFTMHLLLGNGNFTVMAHVQYAATQLALVYIQTAWTNRHWVCFSVRPLQCQHPR